MSGLIMTETRKIRAVYNTKGETIVHLGDQHGTDEIVPYEESGQMAPITWLRALDPAGQTIMRLEATGVIIHYSPPADTDGTEGDIAF